MPGHDGLPNLRPGSMPGMLRSQARLYDPELDLHELFDDFIDLSASIITDDTALDYRRCFDQFAAFVVDETRQQRAEAALRAAESATNEQDRKALLARIPEIATEPVRVTLEVIDERWCVAYIANLQRRPKKKGEGTRLGRVREHVRPAASHVRALAGRARLLRRTALSRTSSPATNGPHWSTTATSPRRNDRQPRHCSPRSSCPVLRSPLV